MLKKFIKAFFQNLLLFFIGGSAYYYTEVLLRGWSHWSMFVLGGMCFCFFSLQKKAYWWNQNIVCQLARCIVFLLCGEFITGCMVNLWKGWDVWDYSEVPLNIYGQICFPMALVFVILCYLGLMVDDWIQVYAFGLDKDKIKETYIYENKL